MLFLEERMQLFPILFSRY